MEASARDPQVLQNILADCSPESEPVLEYIQDLEVRLGIFEGFRRLAERVGKWRFMTMAIFGIFMVAPISKLNNLLEHYQNVEDIDLSTFFLTLSIFSEKGIKPFANKGGRQSQSASSSSQSGSAPSSDLTPANPLKRKHERTISNPNLASPTRESPSATSFARHIRSRAATKNCKDRDSRKCIFMRTPDPVGAHLVPFGAVKNASFETFKEMIDMFWKSDQAKVWNDLLNQTNILESAQNLISLNHQLHWWFDNGRIAIKPLRKLDDNTIIVQFHYLKSHDKKSPTIMHGGTMDAWLSKMGLENNSAWGNQFTIHRQSGIPLETGQTFVIKADNPEHLPSFELLKLSWDMLRIIAISGAAEPQDLSNDDCSGDVSIWNEDNYAELRMGGKGRE